MTVSPSSVIRQPANPAQRARPGAYTPRERLMRVLRHEKTDRLPISPCGLSPYTWHVDFPDYHPILDVAEKHCEFLCKFGIADGYGLSESDGWSMKTEKDEQGDRKIQRTELQTPKGTLIQTRVHDRAVGSWASSKSFVNDMDDLNARDSLPFEPLEARLDGIREFDARIGEAGLVYCSGIKNALLNACWGMSEEFRTVFCFTEQERLRRMVDTAQERLLDYVTRLLDVGAGPVFRWYAIEDFVEPMMPPSFVDEFIVPYDREIVKLIHDRGGRVVMHCHGRLGAQIERMLAIGVDGVDCAESPPQNDIDLAGMIEKADGRMVIWGYIQYEDLARKTGDEIETMVRKAVEAGGTEGRYILSQAASPWTAEIDARTRDNWIRMIEAGAKYGGH